MNACAQCTAPVPVMPPCSIGDHGFCSRRCREHWAIAHAGELAAEVKRLRVELNRIYVRTRRGTLASDLARAALWPNERGDHSNPDPR